MLSGDLSGRERFIHMTKKMNIIGLFSLIFLFWGSLPLGANEISYQGQGQKLSNSPDYNWWYGCSPTAAGMMMGYYDVNGYKGLRYDNLVPGGTAVLDTYTSSPGGSLVNSVIASAGHINDFYRNGYSGYGDDISTHGFNSLADFMGTSQDSVGNANGFTTFYYWSNGAKFTKDQAFKYGVSDKDGMYGIWEYLNYAGYNVAQLYTQLILTSGLSFGFTLDDYKAEIDAGRVVMIQLNGHSMLGYGYSSTGNSIYVRDTWEAGDHTMEWGGDYGGMPLLAVTVVEPSGGNSAPNNNGDIPSGPAGTPVPEPATFLFLFTGMISLMAVRRFC